LRQDVKIHSRNEKTVKIPAASLIIWKCAARSAIGWVMIEGKKILITGATGTIGGALVREFAVAGNRIVIHCHRAIETAEGLRKDIESRGAVAHIVSSDLSIVENAERLTSESIEVMGGLDVLIHAAAIFEKTPLGTVTEEQWTRIIDTNLKATFFLAQSAGMSMRTNGGSIVIISDVAAEKPYADYLPYCISKAGIDALVKGLAKALAPRITVNGIAPYVVTKPEGISDSSWSDMLSKMPLHRPTKPEEIAKLAGMLGNTENSITGQIVAVDGAKTVARRP